MPPVVLRKTNRANLRWAMAETQSFLGFEGNAKRQRYNWMFWTMKSWHEAEAHGCIHKMLELLDDHRKQLPIVWRRIVVAGSGCSPTYKDWLLEIK